MASFGISSSVHDDARFRQLSASATALWVESIAWLSRGGDPPMRDAQVEALSLGAPHTDLASELVAAGMWVGDARSGWALVENGLWTLRPDDEPDVFGDGPDAFDDMK